MSKPYSKAVIFEARGLDKKKLVRFYQEAATNDLPIYASFGDEFVVIARI